MEFTLQNICDTSLRLTSYFIMNFLTGFLTGKAHIIIKNNTFIIKFILIKN